MDDNVIEGFNDHIAFYYREFVVCGYARCKSWEKHLRKDIEIHFNDVYVLPNIEVKLPPMVRKYPIGIVELGFILRALL